MRAHLKSTSAAFPAALPAACMAAAICFGGHAAHAEVPAFSEAVKQGGDVQRVVLLPLLPAPSVVVETVVGEIAKRILLEAMRRAFCAALHEAHEKTVSSKTLKPGTRTRIDEAIAELNKAADCHPLASLPGK